MQKMYYSISEVAKMTGLAPHVLRYWETEFKQLRPRKNRAGSRSYRQQDIDIVQHIQTLLHAERYTIEGARRELEIRLAVEGEESDTSSETQAHSVPQVSPTEPVAAVTANASRTTDLPVHEIRQALREILDLLG